MSKLLKRDAKALLAATANIKPPTEGDITLAAAAAITCKSAKEFCEFLEINPAIFNYWCKNYPSYRKAVWAWRDVATNEIEVAMAKRAIGFKKTTRRDVVTKTGQVETLINETYYPPDPTAAQFWLKNRAPNDWQDKKEIDVNVNANIRAWLVQAGGQLDPTEVIEGVSNVIEPLTNLTNDQINNIIINELEDNTQANLENEMVADLIKETNLEANLIAELEAEAAAKLAAEVRPEPNTIDAKPDATPAPSSWQGLNSKWS